LFWNKKIKPPVTEEDRHWIEEGLLLLKDEFGEEHFKSLETILPNRQYYDIEFSGKEEDAVFVLNQTKIYMEIEAEMTLKFFSDEPVLMQDGSILTTPADIYGKWNSAAGLYDDNGVKTTIIIERSQLKDPVSLIATIAHELSHYILLGEGRTDINDEYLTDLVAVAYGFGIFLGNSRFKHSTFNTNGGSGWQMQSSGYLPEQVVAYAMAWLSVYRDEEPVWKNLLNASMLKYFEHSMEFINKYSEKIRFE
jgi:hypothetical protein